MIAAEDEDVAFLEGVEVGLVQLADPLVARARLDIAGKGVRNRPDVGHVDDPREPATLADQALADRVLLVVVFAVGRVVLVAPDLRVDVTILEAGVFGRQVSHERLVLGFGVVAVGYARRRIAFSSDSGLISAIAIP